MKLIATIEIYKLDQGGYKAHLHDGDGKNMIEVYADKIATFLVRTAKAVKKLLGVE